MARTVFANIRNLSHKGSGDKCLSSAPDVCKTPMGSSTPPIPYSVMSKAADASGYSQSVRIDGNPTALANSSHSKCSGDEPGSSNGLCSGTVSDITEFTTYSPDVIIEGNGAVRHMDMSTMNNGNTIGMVYGTTTSAVTIDEYEVEEVAETAQPILRFELAVLPNCRKAGFFTEEPYKLYGDDALLQEGLSNNKGIIEFEHIEGTSQYKITLLTGQEYLIDSIDAFSLDAQERVRQRLANRGYRSYAHEGDVPATYDAVDEDFRRIQAEQGY